MATATATTRDDEENREADLAAMAGAGPPGGGRRPSASDLEMAAGWALALEADARGDTRGGGETGTDGPAGAGGRGN